MIDLLSNNWLIIAFIAPIVWALVNIIDLYLVKEVFDNEYDATIIAGVFQFIPFAIFSFSEIKLPTLALSIMAIGGGFLFVASYFFYFKALFSSDDVTLIQIFWNLIAVIVPILAFLFLGERLETFQYLEIAITFMGVMYLTVNKKIKERKIKIIIYLMSFAALFLSLSMILTKNVYLNISFFTGIWLFSFGGMLAGLFFYLLRLIEMGKGKLVSIGKKYFIIFLLIEGLNLCGVLTSQRAIDISPSVSFVGVIESLMPAFIVVWSAVVFFLFSYFYKKKKDLAKQIYKEQLFDIGAKIFAIVVMGVGIYMINLQ